MSCAIICFYYTLWKVAMACVVLGFIPVTAGMLLNRFSNEILDTAFLYSSAIAALGAVCNRCRT